MVGERRFELPTSWSRTKRATRLRYSPNLKLPQSEKSIEHRLFRTIKIQDLIPNVQHFEKVDNFIAVKLIIFSNIFWGGR